MNRAMYESGGSAHRKSGRSLQTEAGSAVQTKTIGAPNCCSPPHVAGQKHRGHWSGVGGQALLGLLVNLSALLTVRGVGTCLCPGNDTPALGIE